MLTLLLLRCASSLPNDTPRGPKTYKNKMDIRIMGSRRSYLVHVQPDYTPKNLMPLVVVIHGASDTASGMEKYSTLSELTDREGFIVLYPNGMGILGFFNTGMLAIAVARQ